MSLPDMDNDTALATLTARLSSDADDVALGRVLAQVSCLSSGPAPQASAGLAAFLAAKAAPAPVAAPVVVPVRRRKAALAGVLGRRLVPAGLAAKVVLGAAGVALAGTTSLGAAALVNEADDVSNGRTGVRVEQPAAEATQGDAGDTREAATRVADTTADESSAGGSSSDTMNGGTDARRPGGSVESNPAAVDAHSDGKGRDDERAATPGGGERDPRADKPARPDDSTGAGKDEGSGSGRADEAPKGGSSEMTREDAPRRPEAPPTDAPKTDDAPADDAAPTGPAPDPDTGDDASAEPADDLGPQQYGVGSGGKGGRG